jgi:hypothetical protein
VDIDKAVRVSKNDDGIALEKCTEEFLLLNLLPQMKSQLLTVRALLFIVIVLFMLFVIFGCEEKEPAPSVYYFIYYEDGLKKFPVVKGAVPEDCLIGSPSGYCCSIEPYKCIKL